MQLALRPKPFKRTTAAVLIVLIVAAGVAFALLQSQAKLTGNSIETEGTGLLISQNDSNYSDSTTGFDFAHVIPGAQPSQTEHFLLKNTGTADLALKVSAPNLPANPSHVDLSKVNVILTPFNQNSMPGTPQSFPLQSLIDADTDGGLAIGYPVKLAAGTKEEFNVRISMDADAVSGSGAALSDIDFVFTGTAVGSD